MSMTIKLSLCDEEGEFSVTFPAKYSVCTECEGHGTILNPSMADHAYSMEEFMESFEEEERAEYFKRGGRYDITCPECTGARVVSVVDEDALSASQKEEFASWQKQEEERECFDRQWSAEQAMERSMGC